MTVFVGTLWTSVKQIEDRYVFVWENTIALHAMQGNWASSRGEVEVSGVSQVAAGEWVIFWSTAGMSIGNLSLFSKVRTHV